MPLNEKNFLGWTRCFTHKTNKNIYFVFWVFFFFVFNKFRPWVLVRIKGFRGKEFFRKVFKNVFHRSWCAVWWRGISISGMKSNIWFNFLQMKLISNLVIWNIWTWLMSFSLVIEEASLKLAVADRLVCLRRYLWLPNFISSEAD